MSGKTNRPNPLAGDLNSNLTITKFGSVISCGGRTFVWLFDAVFASPPLQIQQNIQLCPCHTNLQRMSMLSLLVLLIQMKRHIYSYTYRNIGEPALRSVCHVRLFAWPWEFPPSSSSHGLSEYLSSSDLRSIGDEPHGVGNHRNGGEFVQHSSRYWCQNSRNGQDNR